MLKVNYRMCLGKTIRVMGDGILMCWDLLCTYYVVVEAWK